MSSLLIMIGWILFSLGIITTITTLILAIKKNRKIKEILSKCTSEEEVMQELDNLGVPKDCNKRTELLCDCCDIDTDEVCCDKSLTNEEKLSEACCYLVSINKCENMIKEEVNKNDK